MKNLLIFPIVILMCFTFCKKKDKTTDAPPANYTGGGGGGGTTTGTPAGLTNSTGGDMCGLSTSYMYYDHLGNVTKDSSIVASFYSAPTTSVAPTNVFGGTVTLNGIVVPYQSSSSLYYCNYINIAGPLTWSVSGSGTVTAFSQSFTPSYPKYTGGNLLPDTCVKANGINITVSGVSNNQNSVVVYLYSGSNSIYKYYPGSNGSVSFTAAELTSFTANQNITIYIYFTNSYTATLGGIKRGFTNYISYEKIAYLK